MRDTGIATSLTPPITGLSNMELGGVRDVALPLSHIKPRLLFSNFGCFDLKQTHELVDPKGPEEK